MTIYKLHRVDRMGVVEETVVFEAFDDDAAIAAASEAEGRTRLELWSGERFVALLREPQALRRTP